MDAHQRAALITSASNGALQYALQYNVDYYVAKLDELVKKFSGITAAASAPKQESLAL